MNLIRQGQHTWNVLDETHRECTTCFLRIYLHPTRGWVLVDYFGRPNDLRLLGDGGEWGTCRPPHKSGRTVVIEYTGDPDVHPGCERIMHALAVGDVAPSDALLGSRSSVRPACGAPLTWWEVGAPRDHAGWTPCRYCKRGEPHPKSIPPPARDVRAEVKTIVAAALVLGAIVDTLAVRPPPKPTPKRRRKLPRPRGARSKR